MLEQEIDRVCKRLTQRGTDAEVACAAVKQLVGMHFQPSETVAFQRLADALFRRHAAFGGDATALAEDLKACITKMQALQAARSVTSVENQFT